MRNVLTIREMTQDDVPACYNIDAQINATRRWNLHDFHRFHSLQNSGLSVATWNGNIVGILGISGYKKRGHIYRLLVDPWHRYNGVGLGLFLQAAKLIEDRPLVIDVREDDLDAQQFLRRMDCKGKLKTKHPKLRDGWKSPEIQGETMVVRFTFSSAKVKRLCSQLERAAQ